jgi:hypothetical protein
MMSYVLAAVLVLHAVPHLVGFVVPWRLARLEGMPYKTTLMGGLIDVGDRGIRIVGLVWLAVAVAFPLVASSVVVGTSNWVSAVTIVTSASLVLCILGWPESRFGVAVNAGVFVLLAIGSQLGLFSG